MKKDEGYLFIDIARSNNLLLSCMLDRLGERGIVVMEELPRLAREYRGIGMSYPIENGKPERLTEAGKKFIENILR